MLAAAVASALAFSAPTSLTANHAVARASLPSASRGPMMLEAQPGRRAAVLAAVAAAALPLSAQAATYNDLGNNVKSDKDYTAGSDEAIYAIAKRNAEKQAEEKRKFAESRKPKTSEELLEEQENAKRTVFAVGAGGTLASTAFFYQNIQRLFVKVSSGGQDAGYGTVREEPKKAGRGGRGRGGKASKNAPPPAQALGTTSAAEKLFKAAFGRATLKQGGDQ